MSETIFTSEHPQFRRYKM